MTDVPSDAAYSQPYNKEHTVFAKATAEAALHMALAQRPSMPEIGAA